MEHYDLMTAVMICLGDSAKAEGSELLRLLDVLFSNEIRSEEKKQILQDEFDIPMTHTLSEEVNRMSSLAQGVWEKGRKAGIEKGIEEGEMNMIPASRHAYPFRARDVVNFTFWSSRRSGSMGKYRSAPTHPRKLI